MLNACKIFRKEKDPGLAFFAALCYTVNRCKFHKLGFARKITECSRPSTRKTKLKEN